MVNLPKFKNMTTKIFWFVFLCLLGVLLPHTAWLFKQFEPDTLVGTVSAWVGAFAFEAAIAVLTHKLAKHIEQTPRRLHGRAKFLFRYANAYAAGLLFAVVVSSLANLAHSVEFGRELIVFTAWGIPEQVYQIAFGAVLPVVSILFARVLSNVSEIEQDIDPELEKANAKVREVAARLRETEQKLAEAERVRSNEFTSLIDPDKSVRIHAAKQLWPDLPVRSIAVIADASQGYVSDVLSKNGHAKEKVTVS
jgi:hypothetical protein